MKQVEITNVETENVSVIKKMDFTYDNEKYYLECLFDESCFTVILLFCHFIDLSIIVN